MESLWVIGLKGLLQLIVGVSYEVMDVVGDVGGVSAGSRRGHLG